MQNETSVLHEWTSGVRDALSTETDARRALLNDILDMLHEHHIDANADVVAQKLVEFLTREVSVQTSPGLRPKGAPSRTRKGERRQGQDESRSQDGAPSDVPPDL